MGFGIKMKRNTNEAKGYSASMTVSPHSVGTIKMYYGGYKSCGKLTTCNYSTAAPNKKIYKTRDVMATFYKSSTLDIHTVMSEKKIKK